MSLREAKNVEVIEISPATWSFPREAVPLLEAVRDHALEGDVILARRDPPW